MINVKIRSFWVVLRWVYKFMDIVLKQNIPNGWRTEKVETLFEIGRGRVISKEEIQRNPGPYPVYSSQTSNNGEFGKMGTYDFDGEYLTWTTDGIYAGAVFYRTGKFNCTNVCGTLKKKVNMDIRFFSYALPLQAESHVVKTANPKLMNNVMARVLVLVPPIKEQQKIAEILGAVDEDITKTREVIETTEKLKKGLMQQLFTRGIGHTKFKETKIGQIPEEWNDSIIRDICTVRQGLQIPISERFKERGDNRYLYITIKYLRNAHLPGVAEYIESPSSSVICYRDDILMTRTGNTGTVITNTEGVFHNNFFLVDYNREKINKDFLVHYLNSEIIQKTIKVRAGSTTIPDLNHGDFYSLPICLPTKEEQQKIAEILSAVDEKISINKNLKNKLTILKKGLMQDLLSGRVRVIYGKN